MTTKRRNALLAKIHIAVHQLGLDDDTYRDILQSRYRVRSAGKLAEWQMLDLLNDFRAKGWNDKSAPPATRAQPINIAIDREALIGKIEALLAEARRPWAYAHAMAKRMFGSDRLEWLAPDQLHRLVAALMIDARRAGRKTK